MRISKVIDLKALEGAIDRRHHAMERFYDADRADETRSKNLDILDRLKKGIGSKLDEEAALDLINSTI